MPSLPSLLSLPSRASALTLLATLALGATACGGDDGDREAKPEPAQTSLTGPGVEPSENFATAEKFFDAVADATPANLAIAKDLAAPRSDAARYVANLEGLAASGKAPTGGSAEEQAPGTYRLCDGTGMACLVADEVLLVDGKVSSFDLDGQAVGATK